MEEFEGQLSAVVVGDFSDRFVQQVMSIFGDYEIEAVHCRDVYSAVGRLAAGNHNNVLVVGRFAQLNKEQGRFFQLAGEKGLVCCCLAEGDFSAKDRRIPTANGEVFFIREPAEIEEMITKLLSGDSTPMSERKKNKKAALNGDDFLATKAELDALFGA